MFASLMAGSLMILAPQGAEAPMAAAPASLSPTIEESTVAGFPHARIYRLAGEQRRPVLIILPGAEGGDGAGKRFGPILARLGYAAVSLPYYSPNWGSYGPPPEFTDLPGSFIDIRVDQLAALRAELAKMPGADTDRIGLFAGSKGSEFALIAASHYPWISAVVAYAPSDLVWEGWGLETVEAEGTRSSFSFDGKPLPFMPYRGFVEGLQLGDKADLRAIHENGRADHPDREKAARIPVEQYRGRLMLVAGDRDQLWNSGRMARNIAASRKAAGLETEALLYPDAGHDLGGASAEPRDDPRGGGTPEANATARADAWPKVVAFLQNALKP
ncbi:dienelactone hydrolase [Sphingopyxis sp. BSN-002]|uniref:acyl-CoA thioester hydrolase/BAAT C-terminal domain-containing protein n=1 Tax=Sphingopyxis sp. BSN-002 TaxID=2911495 RepID=UPI001EDC0615|nr:acyl-CoA thioester hydrolase/BAAT C-terminal domain-containing protein [Sphingopyxis sp. BSN-002]UKK84684.1 dienelactone hydrolase [Sphingopyxis sp. BSN-002]